MLLENAAGCAGVGTVFVKTLIGAWQKSQSPLIFRSLFMRLYLDTPQKKIIVVTDPAAAARYAADLFKDCAQKAIAKNGLFTVALSGGSTPKALYHLLATDESYSKQIAWEKVHLFWGDERFVPADHPESNYRMVKEQMLHLLSIPADNVHRIISEGVEPEECAAVYGRKLRAFFGEHNLLNSCGGPAFDLNFLGLGPDGHTASLFPDSKALSETHHWCAANWVEKFNSWRITLTYPSINSAKCIAFLAVGQDKTEKINQILGPDAASYHYPAQGIKPTDGALLWVLDEVSAGGLS